MPISNANFAVIALLDELHTQCMLIQRAATQLENGADHWIKLSRGEDFDRKFPPLDILAWCTVCLAGMTAIRRLIIGGKDSPTAARRRLALRRLLDDPHLPNIGSATVRNSWEHFDERLDTLIPTISGGSLSHLRVAPGAPDAAIIALRRFDPLTLTIYFVDQEVLLRPAVAEVGMLRARLDQAMLRLHDEIVDPWA